MGEEQAAAQGAAEDSIKVICRSVKSFLTNSFIFSYLHPQPLSIRDLFTTLTHRFRPLNDTEERTGSKVIVKFPSGSDDQCVSISGKVYMFDKVRGSTASWRCGCDSSFFVFKVLKPNVTQSQVYDATAKNIVKGKLECS